MTRPITLGMLLTAVAVLLSVQFALSGDGYSVRHTAEFSLEEFSFGTYKGYDLVQLREGTSLAEPGKPMLPSRQIRIALPPGMRTSGIQIVGSISQDIPGEFNVFPAQPAKEIGTSGSEADFVGPDPRLYSSGQPYPSQVAELVGQTDLAGQAMAVIRLFPLQYIPSQKKLVLHTSITLTLEGVGGYLCADNLSPKVSERSRRAYQRMAEDMVENPGEVRLIAGSSVKGSAVLPAGGFDHVIITSPLLAWDFQPLADWHNQKGVRDTVITTDWIYLNYAGADTQKIRNFIADACTTWGSIYFLLGGEHPTVPFAYRNYRMDTSSDQYYSDFDDDWTHEVYLGRVSAESALEISTFIDKVLKYEKDPPRQDYALDVLLVGMDYDADTHCEELKENIDFGYIPSRFNPTKVYDSYQENHRTAVINALNAGQNLVNHADHSSIEYMGTGDRNHGWGIVSSDVDALNNDGQLSVIVSTGCHPNHMDFDDCIAEHFVIYNPLQGAVAFNGNTRSGVYYEGDPFSLSNALEKQWWVSLFFRGKYNLGQILMDAKHHFSHSDDTQKHCHWTLNLLGEPEMPVWTDDPDSFVVTHPTWLPPESWSFLVHVDDAASGAPVSEAYVCLWKAGEVYLTGYSDAQGDVDFSPAPSTSGEMYVTVTMQNYLPQQSRALVSEYMPGDVNSDMLITIDDVVYLLNYLYKSGQAPDPLESGDANCDLVVDLSDAVFLLNYLFRNGPAPGCL